MQPHVIAHGMEITYCSGGLVKVNLDNRSYEIPASYERVKGLISQFGPFSHSQDVHYAAVLLTLEQHYPDRKRTDADQAIITRVNQARNSALTQTV